MSRFLLEAERLSVSRSGVRILSDISLGLHAGELVAVLGPSGSGKSTLLKVLGGVMEPDRGAVRVRGAELGRLEDAAVARTIGMVPQDDVIHADLRLHAALRYAARLRLPPDAQAAEVDAAVTRVLRAVDLEERARVRIRRLSGGQRKRASVALELLVTPPVLMLDEPTSGLDPALEAQTMGLLRDLAHEGRLVVTTTHATASVDVAGVLIVIVGGHLAWAGPPGEALEHFRVDELDSVFRKVREAEPATWARRFAGSATARRMQDRPSPLVGAS